MISPFFPMIFPIDLSRMICDAEQVITWRSIAWCSLAFWWCVSLGGTPSIFGTVKTVLGPFRNEYECHQMRSWVETHDGHIPVTPVTSLCWWDGRD